MYQEKVNPEICQKLSIISFSKFKDFYEIEEDEVGRTDDIKVQYDLLKKYCKLQIDNNYNLQREYKYSNDNEKGRLFVKDIGIQRLWNKFRGILCHGINYDFDMKNAHPTLLSYICKQNKISCIELDSYINNRDNYLSDLMKSLKINRDEAKKIILKSMNKNKEVTEYNKKKIKCESFNNLDKCFKNIQKILWEKIKIVKCGNNKEGKNLNHILCDYENKCLQLAINQVKEDGIINALMFDGFMMETDKSLKYIIKKLNKATKKYNIEWTNKEHNTELMNDIKNLKNDDIYSFVEDTEKDLVTKCLQTFLKGKLLTCNNNFYMLDPFTDLWINNKDIIKRKLRSLLSNHDLYYLDSKGKPFLVSKYNCRLNSLCDMILDNVEENSRFLEDMYYNTKYKIKFNNGYYDFEKEQFITDIHLDSFIKIDRDYNPNRSEEAKKYIYDKILNPIFTVEEENTDRSKLRDHFLYKMKRVIGGYNEDKDWFSLIGERNSGKGVLSDLSMQTFESYIQTTNSENLLKRRQISEDPSKQRHWMVDLRFARLIITQEIQNDVDTILNGVIIKSMCSGGDIIKARKLNQNEEEFRLQCSLLLCANDMPVIKPTDTLEKLITYNMKSIFINDSYSEPKLNTFKYYKQDPNIKNRLADKKLKDEFLNIILDAQKVEYPKNLLEENKNNEDDDNNDKQKLFDLFEFSNNDNNRISNKDLKFYLKDENINMSVKKAKILLKCKGCKDYRDSQSRGLSGLKLISDNPLNTISEE